MHIVSKKWWYWPSWMMWLMTIVFLLCIWYLSEKNIVGISFVDEDDNFIVGWYLLQGQKIYSDLFSHHQPLAYIMSAAIEMITHPNSIFLLVKRHRECMLLWMVLWDILLVWRFRWMAVPFIFLFEISKNLLLGNLFLSESQVVYPLVYMTFTLFTKKGKWSMVEMLFFGFCASFIVFQLSPLWPLVLVLFVYFCKQNQLYIKQAIGYFIGGFLPLLLLCVWFSSLSGYLYSIFVINGQYYIPLTTHEPFIVSVVKGFLTPVLVFTSAPLTQLTWIMRTIVVVLFIETYFFLRAKRYQQIVWVYILLGVANIRFIQPGIEIYQGFHILPWYAMLIACVSYMTLVLFQSTKVPFQKWSWIVLLCATFFVVVLQNRVFVFSPHDVNRDLYVNYSEVSDMGTVIQIMKKPEDTLFVRPAKSLVYWGAAIPHASPMFFYYPWMDLVPQLKQAKDTLLEKKSPTFVYCDCSGGAAASFAIEKQQNLYTQLKRDGKLTGLFVLKKRIATLTPEQKKALQFYRFETVFEREKE